ncbi:MAG: hypothetical protein LBR64_06055 [Dysgonamonadaceae bacterium]|jgi:membrane-bound ClpP family serine protease|nr:hypothetical protein [Dysgonamonadaceae bacterium]
MDIFIVIVLCLVGILLVLVEIFLIPGVSFALIAGILFGVGGIFYAYSRLGIVGGTIALVLMLLAFGVTFIGLIKSKALDRLALKTDIDSTVASSASINIKEGDTGISVSRLNPIGKVKVNNITMEAKTLGEFMDENTEIQVVKVSPVQLIVKSLIKN